MSFAQTAPAVHRSRFLEVALALGAFSIGTAEFASMSLLPQFTDALHVDVPAGGRAISAYALGVVVGAPVLAMLGAAWRRRTFLAALMVVYAIANVASAFAPTFRELTALRFVAGLPHGAYFGGACLFASSLVPEAERARATARVMLGFTIGTIVGVPLAATLGRSLDWRWAFGVVGVLATLTACAVYVAAPDAPGDANASWRRELGALGRRQVWLALGIGAIGQGGIFCLFSYLASALDAAHAGPAALPIALALFGVGMAIGVVVNGQLADRIGPLSAALVCLCWSVAAMSAYALASGHVIAMLAAVALVGGGGGLATTIQTRLMDVAGDAQTMAAALNHAAFNVANAIGPAAGGLALAAGYGWASTGWVGAALAIGGLVVWTLARADSVRTAART